MMPSDSPLKMAIRDTVNHFLTIGAGLAYAEPHDHEYGRFVHPFIAHQINAYQHAKNEYEQTNPNGVFNLDEQEARLCFYMLRNLIRRGVDREHAAAEDVTDEIRMLLSIPSVRALCHLPMSDEGGENELLRLAIRIGNQEASSLLLQLPEVRRVAEQHNFYENEGDGTLDLRQMAQDKESSMVALSVSEREVVNQLKQHYQGKINELGGHTQAFASLKNELKKRYEANPTTLELVDRYGKKHTQMLPFEWDEFQQLKEGLSKEQYKNALIAYHQHEAHTAYRYLSKPNPWMADNASYVYVYDNEQGQQTALRYSTFEEYQALINLFYLAAFDEEAPAIDGYTLEGRKTLFIKQIALIGRAHNWDKSRVVTINGVVQYDQDGSPKEEEYDDVSEGDKPSCYSGVLRRLMQSVFGHGLFKVVTANMIKQTLNEYIKPYFDNAITKDNCAQLQQAYEGLINGDGDVEEHLQCLKTINIPEDTKKEIMQLACAQLENTYKSQFSNHKDVFEAIMTRYLNAAKQSGCDFIYFQSSLSLERVLEERVRQKNEPNQLSENPVHFWSATVPGAPQEPEGQPLNLAEVGIISQVENFKPGDEKHNAKQPLVASDEPPKCNVSGLSFFKAPDESLKVAFKLMELCTAYQAYLYKEIQKVSKKKITEVSDLVKIPLMNLTESPDLAKLVRKCRIVNHMIDVLENSEDSSHLDRIRNIETILTENKEILAEHRSTGGKFLQAVLNELSTLVSFIYKKEWKCKAKGEVLSDALEVETNRLSSSK
ncbi:hypothetical protein [Legionella drancourtii]|uniref:Uncharacterized protein n=1 Tax=Legionella drancourtii LLAP12 TaxID=658187 RepID=G9EKP9_9GAMM|nr:hypothetical protein [Legionella drancourtii]EHL32182.1 hypothetical protein LDG_5787 [Legionella drancourtii LLAP12]